MPKNMAEVLFSRYYALSSLHYSLHSGRYGTQSFTMGSIVDRTSPLSEYTQ